LADLLRQALNTHSRNTKRPYQAGVATLTASDVWGKLDQGQQNGLLSQVELAAPIKPDVSSDTALLSDLDLRNLAARKAEKDAVAGRVADALKLAAQLLEPKIRFVAVEKPRCGHLTKSGSGRKRQEKKLLAALADGPVQVA